MMQLSQISWYFWMDRVLQIFHKFRVGGLWNPGFE